MNILCLDFLNSRWYNFHKPFEEPLKNAKWCDEFCQKWDLPGFGDSEKIFNELNKLRELLHEAGIEFLSHKSISDIRVKKLNSYLKLAHASKQLKKDGQTISLCTVANNNALDWVMSQIVLSFAEMITQYPIERIKMCNNPDCDWIFYDESKSKTRKWCENACASLIKVRKFRANMKLEGCQK